jgi:hypothetical protein
MRRSSLDFEHALTSLNAKVRVMVLDDCCHMQPLLALMGEDESLSHFIVAEIIRPR